MKTITNIGIVHPPQEGQAAGFEVSPLKIVSAHTASMQPKYSHHKFNEKLGNYLIRSKFEKPRKESVYVGCAVSDDGMYVVANYFPAGNQRDGFARNVTAVEMKEDPTTGITARRRRPRIERVPTGSEKKDSKEVVAQDPAEEDSVHELAEHEAQHVDITSPAVTPANPSQRRSDGAELCFF